jgi:hypothetical protein
VESSDGEEWLEKETNIAPSAENIQDQRNRGLEAIASKRDAWMQEPATLGVDYIQSKRPKEPASQFVSAKDNHDLKVNAARVNQHLEDLQRDFESDGDDAGDGVGSDEAPQIQVAYTIGDSGSSWRMTKLQAVYRKAKEENKSVEEVALERYGNLRDFDDAREEERELDRRKTYGKDYVGIVKPSGELFEQRRLRTHSPNRLSSTGGEGRSQQGIQQDNHLVEADAPLRTVPLDSTALNKLKAQMLKAKLRNAPDAVQLEEAYNAAANAALANQTQADVVVLSNMDNRMLAGGRAGEVTAVSGKRGRERGLVVENEDMTIEDMVRQERRSRGAHGGEGRAFAERIAKDGKFVDDLDYMDDNATKLSKRVVQSEVNLRNTAIGDFQKMEKILQSCPLCYHEDSGQPPIAPVISLATRTYLTLTTEPEVVRGGAVIVPIQHRFNLLECDDDEWEEMRNFMKSLTRFYHAQDKGVIFYENAVFMSSRKGHAALIAVPLPHHLAENAPAYFKEAILASDEQWSQHKPIIDTLALAQRPGYGKAAFRRSMVKEMPYFHVFFTIDGGMGHVVEDESRWPRGDLFAREVVGGMLGKGPEVIKKQGRWERHDNRIGPFKKKWEKFDWTSVLIDAQ